MLTFANPAFAGEVHYIGEVWATTVWDMAWNIIQQEGFDQSQFI